MVHWRPEFDPDHLYFVTTTAAGRAHLFKRNVILRILVNGLYHLSTVDRNKLFAFVIMPNHIHMVLQCLEKKPLYAVMRDFKANTARLIVRQLLVENDQRTLAYLGRSVLRPNKQRYKVWEDGYLAKAVYSAGFLKQKLEYIHNNPLQAHWDLAQEPEEYIWSSARFYLLGEPALIPIYDASEFL